MARRRVGGPLDMEFFSSLGFGPEALSMNEPRLFIDRTFLGSLIVELESELDPETAKMVLFQIGLMHGLRDACRVVYADFLSPQTGGAQSTPEAPPLAIRFDSGIHPDADGNTEIPGCWPEGFEAEARSARSNDPTQAGCQLSAGYTSGWLSGILDADILVHETACCSGGEDRCRFVARETSGWEAHADPWIETLLTDICFDSLREMVTRNFPPPAPDRMLGHSLSLDPDTSDIHVWGPVMVLPFTDPEIALQSVDRLGRDSATCAVRVVVLDLRNRILDESFEAAALEAVLAGIESWGAEVILTGVCPQSERAVSELESSHLLLRKSLSEAITTAFQVAEAQRHLL